MEEIEEITIDDPRQILDLFKTEIALMQSRTLEDIIFMIPQREYFDSEETYLLMKRLLSLEAIDMVKEMKHTIFSNVLDSYNEIITQLNLFKARYSKEQFESEEIQKLIKKSMKRKVVISAGISVLLPSLIPLVLLVGGPMLGMDKMAKDYHKERYETNNEIKETFDIIHQPFYEFVTTLRRDYHESKRELKELEKRAINGEDITNELLGIANPERIGLEYIEPEYEEDEDLAYEYDDYQKTKK